MSQSLCKVVLAIIFTSCFAMAQQPPRPDAPHKPAAKAAPAAAVKVFPYQVHTRTLKNGLNVVIIPTPEFKDMVTYSTAVFAGSRNETERGKTGLAHLFEHVMFLHQYGSQNGGYEEVIRAMGAHNNAWTNYDMTFYHPTTFTSNLIGPIKRGDRTYPGLIELEASRFQSLSMDRKTFEVEAGAVLGEYRRIFSMPQEKMMEVLSEKAFTSHPYGHTVIGYLADVEKMPQAWDAASQFYHHYYQPNSLALVIVGDVNPDQIFAAVEKNYADWKPVSVPQIAPEPEPKAEVKVHVPWEADVSPHVMVGYRTPAAHPGDKDTAIGQIISELLVSRSAPLYQKLRYEKQTVTDLGMAADPITTDPQWVLLDSELMLDRFRSEGTKYVDGVQADMIAGLDQLKSFSRQPDAARTLDIIKSRTRNDLLAALNSTGNIAQAFAIYYRFDRDPQVFDRSMASIDSLTPADIDAYAQKYFTPNRRVIANLWRDQNMKVTAQNARQEVK